MKTIYFAAMSILLILSAQAQIFVPKLPQTELLSQNCYVVTLQGDTISGLMTSNSMNGPTLTRFTIKSGGEKYKFNIEDIRQLVVNPDDFVRYNESALLPALRSIKNDAFIDVLPEGGQVIFETILLPGNGENYALVQLLNPGFDHKIKVYAHPNASDMGSSTLNGIALEGLTDDRHFVIIRGRRPTELQNWGYRKNALSELYENCDKLKGDKLKWKDLAIHIFTYDQNCD